MAGFL